MGSDLVCLGEGRVVKDSVPEVFNGAIQCEHALADMEDLRTVLTDGIHAQQLQCVRMEPDILELESALFCGSPRLVFSLRI